MYLLPSENHTLIIQTFAEKETEPCEIKIHVTGAKNKKITWDRRHSSFSGKQLGGQDNEK